MKTRRNTFLLVLAAGAVAAGLAACSSTPNDYSYKAAADIRSDVTPALETINRRTVDRENNVALVEDSNLRAFNDDWDKFWLLDSPSRLTEFPHVRR